MVPGGRFDAEYVEGLPPRRRLDLALGVTASPVSRYGVGNRS